MDLVELLEELGIEFRRHGEHHHSTFGHVQTDCPRCSPNSGNFRFGIRPGWRTGNCWTCGAIPLIEVLQESAGSGTDYRKLLRSLDFRLPDSVRKEVKRGKLVLPDPPPKGLLPIQREYLLARGFNPEELVRLWGIQGFGLHPRFTFRLFIPITYRGEVVSWTTRSLGSKGRRYFTASPLEEKLSSKSLLFGEDYCRHALVITEGPFDAMKIGPGAVAVLGTSYTKEQLAKLTLYPRRVICFDSEPDAQRRARELLTELSLFPGETMNIVLESGKDPAEADEEEIQDLRKRFLEGP